MRAIDFIRASSLLAVLVSTDVSAQSQDRDVGHCVAGGRETFACWNPRAGNQIPENSGSYPEFLPNLRGWDFRVNLPYVRFQLIRPGFGSPTAMAGVIEDSRAIYRTDQPLEFVDYGHRNNAIWLFRANGSDGQIYFSILPSRVDGNTGRPENVSTLTGAWFKTPQGPGRGFRRDRIGVAVVGKGIGMTTVHLVAWGHDGRLYHSQRLVNATNITGWTAPWQDLGVHSIAPPSLVAAGANEAALAWVDPNRELQVRVLTGGNWSAPVRAAQQADPYQARLVWDGTSLNLVYSGGNRLRHAYRLGGTTLAFSTPTTVSSFLPVFAGQFDVIAFNKALHVAVRTQTGNPAGSALFYTATKTPSGAPAQWTIPSAVEFPAADAVRIAVLYDNIFVIARTPSGKIAYARKDPNAVDNRITGGALSDRWLDVGTLLDVGTPGSFSALETLSFNSDVYLTAQRSPGPALEEGMMVNFGRAAMKQLLTRKWQMTLNYAEPAGNQVQFGGSDEIRMVGDFNGDQRIDIIRFLQRAETGVGPAPAHVRLVGSNAAFGSDAVWHRFFSLKGEIPLVGDFNGDMKDDIITFVQEEQKYANGTVIGPAPVWVALSNGSRFNTSSVWHRFFSLKGEIPLVGDFNGDGKSDIVTFVQKQQLYANGTPIGPAPVWVSLSNGNRFLTSRIWHTFFSLQGEIPLVGDFNGDGKDDIATFVGKLQTDANGTPLGQAPVWVSLSDGTRFGPSRIWHPFFSLRGEFPMVTDVDMDGKDDIVTFLRGRGQGLQANNVYVAFSTGARFDRSVMWATNQARSGETPFAGNMTGRSLGDITLDAIDRSRPMRDIYVFEPRGMVRVASALRMIPYPVGAPWERYRFFTEKGIGTASFPEWIYASGPNHCLKQPFSFDLLGAAGVGYYDFMRSSVRPGGGQGHILEEQGHALFFNCLRSNLNPFGLYALIYTTPMSAGGLDANNMPGCEAGFDDCRDPEHFFLELIKRYRLAGDNFRSRILNGAPDVRARRRAQYIWLKQHWYKGAEFKRGAQQDVSHFPNGVLCLPGECRIDSGVFTTRER
jgi:VCBS repeat protein